MKCVQSATRSKGSVESVAERSEVPALKGDKIQYHSIFQIYHSTTASDTICAQISLINPFFLSTLSYNYIEEPYRTLCLPNTSRNKASFLWHTKLTFTNTATASKSIVLRESQRRYTALEDIGQHYLRVHGVSLQPWWESSGKSEWGPAFICLWSATDPPSLNDSLWQRNGRY